MNSRGEPRIWITYSWVDDAQGDFAYLVQELRSVGVEATYDRIAIIPGQWLWDQIAARITQDPIDGWGYLMTPNSLASEACREELAYALDRALNTRGGSFPLIGLLHGVRITDVPPALKVRLCVSLANPNWKEEVKAGLEGRPPVVLNAPQTQYVWQVYQSYGGVPTAIAIEVRPRFGEVMYWRFAVPSSASIARWGHGPSGGGPISWIKTMSVDGGSGNINGKPVTWFGSGDKLSPGISAYVVFNGPLPEFIGFGLASDPMGQPKELEIIQLR
jgi:hypothetical protein